MAEMKQYVMQSQENGAVLISEDVIATIATNTISDMEGVVGLCIKQGRDLSDVLSKKNRNRGLVISIDQDNAATIDCNVNIEFGQTVVTVAQNIQTAVTAAIESATGIKVNAVNVNVCGIIRQ